MIRLYNDFDKGAIFRPDLRPFADAEITAARYSQRASKAIRLNINAFDLSNQSYPVFFIVYRRIFII